MTPYYFSNSHSMLSNSKKANMLRKYFSSSRGRRKSGKGGFTLVELIVSIGLFSIVMLISVGALLALTGANRKAQALQSVMNNLNIALDGMVRSIRMGSDYNGSSNCTSNSGGPKDCTGGTTVFSFEPFGGNPTDPTDQWVYSYSAGRIYKSVQGGANPIALTSLEITIDSMKFYVVGTQRGDTNQPKVVVTMQGTAGASNLKTKTTFRIQATAVQRLLDL